MTWTLLLSFFALGAIVGSFLNVVTLRYGAKKLHGRSLCLLCGKQLHWFELIPVLSFLVQRGRCRGCKSRLSLQYPLVELVTALVFAAVAWKEFSSLFSSYLSSSLLIFHISYFIFHLLLWCLLIALSVYDFRHKILPDALVYGAGLCAFALFLISYFIFPAYAVASAGRHTSYLLDFWSGFFFAAPFALIWWFSRGKAMGLGDAKLVLLFPWFLGLARGLSALILGFWLGAVFALGALLIKRILSFLPAGQGATFRLTLARLGLKTELPLGPFLILGLFLVYLFGWDVTGLSLLLQPNEL